VNVTGTSGTGAASAGTTDVSSTTAPKGLGQDAFLKLLITQLENQDPTQPKEDTEFISQLAVFTQLEKLTEIAASVKLLTEQLSAQPSGGTDASGSTTTTPEPGA
jgi:flagellar basal-body rod modification protein FlgD